MPRDFSYSFPDTISSMTFHEKLYHLLTKDSIGTRQSINWSAHGRSFEITSPPKLVRFGVLHAYFGYGMMQQFRKELNKYGYKQLARTAGGTERYYSEVSLCLSSLAIVPILTILRNLVSTSRSSPPVAIQPPT